MKPLRPEASTAVVIVAIPAVGIADLQRWTSASARSPTATIVTNLVTHSATIYPSLLDAGSVAAGRPAVVGVGSEDHPSSERRSDGGLAGLSRLDRRIAPEGRRLACTRAGGEVSLACGRRGAACVVARLNFAGYAAVLLDIGGHLGAAWAPVGYRNKLAAILRSAGFDVVEVVQRSWEQPKPLPASDHPQLRDIVPACVLRGAPRTDMSFVA
jgi:hypothetical protein